MSALSEELINKIMLYVSHPCADMINNAITQDEDSKDKFKSTKYKTFKFIDDYDILPHYGNPQYYEDVYEFEVIRIHIYNKLRVWAITEDDILRLCPEYLHMNRKVITGLINEDAERIDDRENGLDDNYDYELLY
jgi:hypothetical protein